MQPLHDINDTSLIRVFNGTSYLVLERDQKEHLGCIQKMPYDGANHHVCARKLIPDATNFDSVYYCTCSVCLTNTDRPEFRYHFFATSGGTKCDNCRNGKHPKWS